jgi:undecaprenyl-diphosphatase
MKTPPTEKAKVSRSLVVTNEIFMFAFLLVLVGVVTDSFISNWDLSINLTMASIQGNFFTMLSKVFDFIFSFLPMAITSAAITAYLFFKDSKSKDWKNTQSRKDAIFFAAALAAAEIIISLLKILLHRARPPNALVAAGDYAFPSGHTAFALVFFGLIAYLLYDKMKKNYRTIIDSIFSFIVLLIGFTRIYLNVHWLSDVLAGLFLGGFLLTAAIIFRKKYAKK